MYKRQGDVHAACVVEGDEVDVEEEFGGSVVECVSENDEVCEDVKKPSVCGGFRRMKRSFMRTR